MFLVARTDNTLTADLLESLGADPFAVNHVSENAVGTAASANAANMLKWFHARGVPFRFSGAFLRDVLADAAGAGALESLTYLFEAFPEETNRRETLDQALHTCSFPGIIDVLIARGANIDALDAGDTLLMSAAREGCTELVRYLLDVGADPNATSTGATSLHSAVMSDDDETVSLLLDGGADPNAEDVDGDTPLMFSRSVQVARMLIARGADPALENPYLAQTAREMLVERDPRFAEAFV